MKKMKLFPLAWPIFVETALFMLLGFVDVYIMSRYDDIAASAVNTANQAVSIVTIIFTVISGASAVLISQYLGAEKRESASRIAALSIAFNVGAGVIISVFLMFFSVPMLELIGAKDDVMKYASQYLSIVGGTMFFQSFLNAAAVIIRNHGLTRITMYVSFGMNVLNAGLDLVLVPGLFGMPRLGVAGAAIATVSCRLLGTVVAAVVLFSKVEKLSIFRLLRPFPKSDLADMMKIGIPSALETFLYNLSQLAITSLVLNFLTPVELITKTYVQNITMFFYLFAVAIGQASQIITGHYVGAKKFDEAYRQGFSAYLRALVLSLSVCAAGVLLRYNLMGIFTENKEVIELGANILLLNILLEFGRTTNLVVIANLRGAGDVYFPTACAVFSMWFISVLGSYLLAVVADFGIYGLWIALAADECFRGVLMISRWKGGKWRTKGIQAKKEKKQSAASVSV